MHLLDKYLFLIVLVVSTQVVFAQKTENENKKKIGINLFNDKPDHEIRIYLTQCNSLDSLTYYKNNLEQSKYIQGNVMIDSTMIYAVGVRYKGESSYEFTTGKKKSFAIKFNEYIKGQKYDGLLRINLSNGFKDPTFLREKLYFDFLRKENLPAPMISFANVYVNNEFYGFYSIQEHIDKKFLNSFYKNNSGALIKGEPFATLEYSDDNLANYISKYMYVPTTDSTLSDLVKFLKILNDNILPDKEYKASLDAVFNTEECIKVWAITNLFCNVDAYNMNFPHNFYLYKNPETGKFEWIPYDGNYAFCAWSPDFTLQQAEQLSVFYSSKNNQYKNPLYTKMMSNQYYKEEYKKYFTELISGSFTTSYFNAEIDRLAILIRKNVYKDKNKLYSNDEFENNLEKSTGNIEYPGGYTPGLKSFVKNRIQSVKKELSIK